MFYENLQRICELKGLKITPIVKECGGATGSISAWKNGAFPNADIVIKLAMRLNVSTDCLLIGADTHRKEPITDEELQQLINEYKELDKSGRLTVRSTVIQELQRLEIGQDVTNIMEIKKSKTHNAVSSETYQNKPIKHPESEEKQAL